MSQGLASVGVGTDDLNIKITIQVLGGKGQSAQMLLQQLLLGDSQLSPLSPPSGIPLTKASFTSKHEPTWN